MKGFLNGLRFALKYGAYLTAIFSIIGFAITEFEKIKIDEPKDDK